MATKSKKEKWVTVNTKPLVTVDPCLPEFEKHPFFEKKLANAKAFLAKNGLPKDVNKKAR